MYYHIRLDKIQHDGRTDMDAQVEWDFRSLHQGLGFIKRDFGADAVGWRIEYLTDRTDDPINLEQMLMEALKSTYQFVIMSFREDSQLAMHYDCFQFFVVIRDEAERPPKFAFSEADEATI